jgi:hypothetical protein
MSSKVGFGGLNASLNKNLESLSNKSFNDKLENDNDKVIGKVVSITLTEEDAFFKEKGEWSTIGAISFENINKPSTINNAYPLNPNIKIYPLINELVQIFTIYNTSILDDKGRPTKKYYYGTAINMWNTPHHNAVPIVSGTSKNYKVSSLGSTNKEISQQPNINLGSGVVERGDIHPLWPFPGDLILEGRWSNSIRLGSTFRSPRNSWSGVGENGSPITIISNGQPEDSSKEGYLPISEDINKDLSSIYLTSNQKIPIVPAQFLTKSYTTAAPDRLNQYAGSQVILNANRILINSNKDHILLNSFLTIGFNSAKGFNFDTESNFIVNAEKIQLGSKTAGQPALRGKETLAALDKILEQTIKIAKALSSLIEILPAAPYAAVNAAAANAEMELTALQASIKINGNLISKNIFLD